MIEMFKLPSGVQSSSLRVVREALLLWHFAIFHMAFARSSPSLPPFAYLSWHIPLVAHLWWHSGNYSKKRWQIASSFELRMREVQPAEHSDSLGMFHLYSSPAQAHTHLLCNLLPAQLLQLVVAIRDNCSNCPRAAAAFCSCSVWNSIYLQFSVCSLTAKRFEN